MLSCCSVVWGVGGGVGYGVVFGVVLVGDWDEDVVWGDDDDDKDDETDLVGDDDDDEVDSFFSLSFTFFDFLSLNNFSFNPFFLGSCTAAAAMLFSDRSELSHNEGVFFTCDHISFSIASSSLCVLMDDVSVVAVKWEGVSDVSMKEVWVGDVGDDGDERVWLWGGVEEKGF